MYAYDSRCKVVIQSMNVNWLALHACEGWWVMHSLLLMEIWLSVCVCVCALYVLTILTGQMLGFSVSLLCDWFTADKQKEVGDRAHFFLMHTPNVTTDFLKWP